MRSNTPPRPLPAIRVLASRTASYRAAEDCLPRSIHLTVVSPVYRAEDCVEELWRRVTAAASAITPDYEIVLVDDCSPDASWREIHRIAVEDPRVRGVQLTRNFGQHRAVAAGLRAARGEWVVVLDCDLQDPPEDMARLYAKATDEGHHCVMARRMQRTGGVLKRMQSAAFYTVFSYLTEIQYDGAVSNFSIISRQVVDDILSMEESSPYFPGYLFWLGYPTAFIEVSHQQRFAGSTSYSLSKLLAHSQSIILSHSTKPLRMCLNFGFAIMVLSFSGGLFYFVWSLAHGIEVSGWASLIISLYFSTGSIILTLGIVGLYVGRIFTEVKSRPLFVVRRRTFEE